MHPRRARSYDYSVQMQILDCFLDFFLPRVAADVFKSFDNGYFVNRANGVSDVGDVYRAANIPPALTNENTN